MTDISILTHLYVDMQRLTSDSSNICRASCVFILRNSVPRYITSVSNMVSCPVIACPAYLARTLAVL